MPRSHVHFYAQSIVLPPISSVSLLSLTVRLSLPMSLSLSLSLSPCLPISLSLSLAMFLSLPLCLSLSVCLFLFQYVFHYVCVFLSCFFPCLSVFLYGCVSHSACLTPLLFFEDNHRKFSVLLPKCFLNFKVFKSGTRNELSFSSVKC